MKDRDGGVPRERTTFHAMDTVLTSHVILPANPQFRVTPQDFENASIECDNADMKFPSREYLRNIVPLYEFVFGINLKAVDEFS